MAYDPKPLLDLIWRAADTATSGRLGGSPFGPIQYDPATGQPIPRRKPKPLLPKKETLKRTTSRRNSA